MTQRIGQVIDALDAIGIPAVRGFVPAWQPELSRPAGAICLERMTETELVLSVTVCCPGTLGGSSCEDAALAAADALRQLGAECSQEACGYDRSTGLLAIRLLARWPRWALPCRVQTGGAPLPYLTGVRAEKKVSLKPIGEIGSGTIAMRWEDMHWDITVEELLPGSEPPAADSIGTFQLDIHRSGSIEQFPGCRWISLHREDTSQGIRQVRIARTWDTRRIVNGQDEL